MQEEFGDDLAVVFVESQGSNDVGAMNFAARQKWLGGRAMWTTEAPFDSGMNGLPSFVLLDVEGKVLLKGYSNSMHKQIEDAIQQQVAVRRKGPKDLPAPVAKVYAELAKGNYGAAVSAADKALAQPPSKDQEAFVAAANAAREAAQAAAERASARVDWLWQNGYPQAAQDLVAELQGGFKGSAALEQRAKELKAQLDAPEAQKELGAGKSLARLEAALYKEGPGKDLGKALDECAEKNAGTRVAERAKRLAEVARG